jgi:hypothetical protein
MAKQIGIITKLDGNVKIIKANGAQHRAVEGEAVYEGDKIVTMQGASVTIIDNLGVPVTITENQTVALDDNVMHTDSTPTALDSALQTSTAETVIAALDRGQDLSTTLDATAAGVSAGGEEDGHNFVAVGRILELVSGNQYAYTYDPLGIPPIVEGAGETQEETVAQAETPVERTPFNPQPSTPVIVPPVVPPVPPPVVPPVPPVTPPEPPVVPPVEPPKDDEEEDDEHKDNGGGNGVDPAPGDSDDTPGDDADGSETPDDDKEEDDKPTDSDDSEDNTEGEDTPPTEEDDEDDETTDDQDEGSEEHSDEDKPHTDAPPVEEDEDEDTPQVPPQETDTPKDNGSQDEEDSEGDVDEDEDTDSSDDHGESGDHTDDSGDDDEVDVLPSPIPPVDDHPNNGFGNGDQDAPGNSGDHNNAENSEDNKDNETTDNDDKGNSGSDNGIDSDSDEHGDSDNGDDNRGDSDIDSDKEHPGDDVEDEEDHDSDEDEPEALNIKDLLTDGKHDLVFEEIAVGKSGKTTTTVHVEDHSTHKEVQEIAFHSHVDHTVQNVLNELLKPNSHD